ncbi:Gas vesicle synthesis protein GvpL/GvpF [Desulfocicer vacuolatum DSM 3385]|uniref:Gas vesicle synthesis protein GvpL/GvpF n=1 Tax=Desulfocicer vacuolatum DSM 3385 TaxID=1121400 RepID=A0A1W2BDJ5_9BACT|nr:GvpL/GvpF family gas vesicle protein [Desulfocicer vacuolatum]SMC70979.1 Gas vesicle synthesis protein GvpL/GvpF [Desulfocicer vacuolatum DSM 3385]
MSKKNLKRNGRYLYAIIEASEEKTFGSIGMDGSDVYLIVEDKTAAVVSDVPNKKIRPQRKNIAAHHAVLNKIMEEITPLPMAFGIIADGEQAIRKILADNRDVFREQFATVSGKVEMGMRISYDVPNIFEYFISTDSEIRAARDQYFGGNREPSQEAKLELGRMFNRQLNANREEYTNQVIEILDDYCDDIKENKCRNEQEVTSLACLINRSDQKRFEEGVFESARHFDNNFSFEYNGPWSPHNFVNILIEL